MRTELRVFTLDLAAAQLADSLHFGSVDNRRKELLTSPKTLTDRDPNDLAVLVLGSLVPKSNSERLAIRPKDVQVEVGIEVQCVHAGDRRLSFPHSARIFLHFGLNRQIYATDNEQMGCVGSLQCRIPNPKEEKWSFRKKPLGQR